MAQGCKSLVDLGSQHVVDGEPVLIWRLPEQRLVEAVKTSKLLDRPIMVVDPKVDERVGEPCVAAVPLDDEQRSRLLATAVSASFLGGREAVEEPFGEWRPAEETNVSARASTVAAETRMLPCAA